MTAPTPTVADLLAAARAGDRDALRRLFPIVYEELRAHARRQRRRWHGDHTLNTTAIVHEAYLKLADQERASWETRAHFLHVAAQAMRHILIDYAAHRKAQKRGGDVRKLPLDDVLRTLEHELTLTDERAEALVVLDEALRRLEALNPRHARIVECRFFGGMTIDETAEALDLSPATVKRGWVAARAWLYREMTA